MYICCTLYRAIVQSGCPMYEWSRETGEWREIPPLLSVALPLPRLAHSRWLTQWVTLDTPGNNSYLNGINRQWILNSSVTFVINEWQSDKYLKTDGRYSPKLSSEPHSPDLISTGCSCLKSMTSEGLMTAPAAPLASMEDISQINTPMPTPGPSPRTRQR